jgi:hypothetical protein
VDLPIECLDRLLEIPIYWLGTADEHSRNGLAHLRLRRRERPGKLPSRPCYPVGVLRSLVLLRKKLGAGLGARSGNVEFHVPSRNARKVRRRLILCRSHLGPENDN